MDTGSFSCNVEAVTFAMTTMCHSMTPQTPNTILSLRSSDSLFRIVESPPESSTTPASAFPESKSFQRDLENVLNIKSPEFKGVNFFDPSFPEQMNYTVSQSVDELKLRRPGPLFPDISFDTITAQEIIQCNYPLQAAAAICTVRSKDSDDGYSEMAIDCKEKEIPMQELDEVNSMLTQISTSTEGMTTNNSFNKISTKKSNSSKRIRTEIGKRSKEQLIDLYIEQRQSSNPSVHFDKIAVTASNQKTVLLSSKGLKQGIHEWHIELWSVDVDLQEIGVIGTDDIDRIPVSDFGAMDTARFKSRAVYGNETGTDKLYYGSWNANGRTRCMRDLQPFFKTGWTVGSVITVKMDLDKSRIKFLLNGESVRYTMSVEPKKEYFPMISFSGNCKFFLH